MKNKKILIPIISSVCAVLLLIGIICAIKGNSNESEKAEGDENTITRYEWLQMLGEECGIKEYTNETPYFTDVDSDNAFFSYVQAAVEWKVIEASSSFKGEKAANGKFVALTAMKTIGESKLKLCLDIGEELTDDVYLELAEEYGLVTKEELKKGFSKEECELLLENLKGLHFGEFWKDDYSEVTYKENVKELTQDAVLSSDQDGTVIEIPKEQMDSYKVGDIIVFEEKTTKIKLARKITRINEDGTVFLNPAKLEEVVDSLVVSDVTEVTFQDIMDYYGLEESADTASGLENQNSQATVMETAFFSKEIVSKGYKITLATEGEDEKRHLKIKITNNETGIINTLPIEPYGVETDVDYSGEINIDKICVGGQASYTAMDGLQYAEAAVDAHAIIKAEVKGEIEKKILLFKTPVALGNGLIGAKIEFYLVISTEGNISVEAEIPMEADVSYEKGMGLKNHECEFSFEEPTVLLDCEASAKFRIEPILTALGCMDIMDMEIDVGVGAEMSETFHENGQVCSDANISFPLFSVTVGEDDDADTLIGTLGLSGEWEIYTSDNAPIKKDLHHEKLPDGTGQFVDECTYGKAQDTDLLRLGTYELPVNLILKSPFEDAGDHYVVKGELSVGWFVIWSDFDSLKEGEHFTTFDKEFVRGSMVQTEEFPQGLYEVYCLDDGETYYVPTNTTYDFGSRFGADYYAICDSSILDYYVYGFGFMSSDLGESEFVIPKDAYITSTMEIIDYDRWIATEYEDAKTPFENDEYARLSNRIGHTAEECYENHILIDDFVDITSGLTAYGDTSLDEYYIVCYVIFDESGTIDTLIFDSFN